MAVKNSMNGNYKASPEIVMEALKDPKFSQLIDAPFVEEAKTSECIEFRYVRKSTMVRYGRNYFVKVSDGEGGSTDVTVVVQSRKVTVLLDTVWEEEAKKIFNSLGVMVDLVEAKSK